MIPVRNLFARPLVRSVQETVFEARRPMPVNRKA